MQQFTKGYAGNILRVNLSTGEATTEPLSEELVRLFVGGRGIAAKILYDELEPGIDPLSPSNKLIFTAGPLAGTPAQSCSRWIVTTKSPQTGGMFRSCAGGGIGLELKYAGFDLLILEGKAEKPSYLFIKDDQVEIREANHLWGLLTRKTTENIRKELGDEKVKVAAIGPSGEKLVRFAAIVDDRRTASRGGVGAVMGSKNLKAIAVRGSKRIDVADPTTMKEITRNHVDTVKNDPKFKGFSHLGTASAVGFCHALGIYPVRNFQEGVLEDVEGRLTGEKVEEIFVNDDRCHLCHIGCGTVLQVNEGPYAGEPVEGPEYETLYSFGGEIGNTDLGMIIEANRICDDYGVDTMSAGCTIGFAMELYEKKILTRQELDGLDLTWGNHGAAIELLKKIVTREGIGDLLAEGTRKAAQKIGKGSEQYAIQVKGLELPGYEPRGLKGSGLNLATAPLGASHCIGQCPQEIMGPEAVDRFSPEGKGKLCKFNQDKVAVYETGIVCLFPMALGLVDLPTLGEMLRAATGIEDFKNEDFLFTVGARILNVERAFNVREGFGRKDDYLPPRFQTEALKSGAAQGHTFESDELLDQYYEARGWDKLTGYPTRATLENLGLKPVADDLEKIDKLP
jgi:aldehyde:ferredoxin oxidoreductase